MMFVCGGQETWLNDIKFTFNISERKPVEEAARACNSNLEHFNRVAVGREFRMIELKRRLNALYQRLGEPPRHEAPLGGGGA